MFLVAFAKVAREHITQYPQAYYKFQLLFINIWFRKIHKKWNTNLLQKSSMFGIKKLGILSWKNSWPYNLKNLVSRVWPTHFWLSSFSQCESWWAAFFNKWKRGKSYMKRNAKPLTSSVVADYLHVSPVIILFHLITPRCFWFHLMAAISFHFELHRIFHNLSLSEQSNAAIRFNKVA